MSGWGARPGPGDTPENISPKLFPFPAGVGYSFYYRGREPPQPKEPHMNVNICTTVIDPVTGGKVAASDGIVYLLTPCCEATATGTMDGVSCRACYATVNDLFGMAWMAADFTTDYPKWCERNGLTSDDPTLFDRLTAMIARDLRISEVTA